MARTIQWDGIGFACVVESVVGGHVKFTQIESAKAVVVDRHGCLWREVIMAMLLSQRGTKVSQRKDGSSRFSRASGQLW